VIELARTESIPDVCNSPKWHTTRFEILLATQPLCSDTYRYFTNNTTFRPKKVPYYPYCYTEIADAESNVTTDVDGGRHRTILNSLHLSLYRYIMALMSVTGRPSHKNHQICYDCKKHFPCLVVAENTCAFRESITQVKQYNAGQSILEYVAVPASAIMRT
jgi:hypothetical protein